MASTRCLMYSDSGEPSAGRRNSSFLTFSSGMFMSNRLWKYWTCGSVSFFC